MDEQRISSQFDDFIKKTYSSLGAPPYDGSIFSAHVDGIDEDLPKLNESRSEIIQKKMIKEYIGYMKFLIEKSSELANSSEKNNYNKSDIIICGISQVSSIINDVTAILLLCSRGLDIAARRQARALYETVNVFILTSHDRNFRTEYLTTTDSKSSNHFWHKFLSKDKDVEAIKKQVAEFWLKGKWYDEVMLRMRKELGRSTHPSLFDNVQQSKILIKRLSPDGWEEVFLTTESVLYFTLFQCWNCIAIGLSGVNKKGSDLWDLILEASSATGDIESLKKWNKVMIVLFPLVSDKLKEEAAAVRKRSPQ